MLSVTEIQEVHSSSCSLSKPHPKHSSSSNCESPCGRESVVAVKIVVELSPTSFSKLITKEKNPLSPNDQYLLSVTLFTQHLLHLRSVFTLCDLVTHTSLIYWVSISSEQPTLSANHSCITFYEVRWSSCIQNPNALFYTFLVQIVKGFALLSIWQKLITHH